MSATQARCGHETIARGGAQDTPPESCGAPTCRRDAAARSVSEPLRRGMGVGTDPTQIIDLRRVTRSAGGR